MSGPLRAQFTNTAFISRDDLTKDNVRPKLTRAVNTKRPALGNVTNQVRRQPQRIAKEKLATIQGTSKVVAGQENQDPLVGKGGKSKGSLASFAIFQDVAGSSASHHNPQTHEDEPMLDQENVSERDLVFRAAVASLNQITNPQFHIPLASLELDLAAGSPMNIDESGKGHDNSLERPDEFGLDPYCRDIYNYMRRIENRHRPRKGYMSHQKDVTTSMRGILVDWLVEVGEEYKLHRETLFLAVAYIDRFMSLVSVSRPKLQLLGAASMFIASKYEEIYPPDVAEFVYVTDDTYTRSQVLKMESAILRILDFRVSMPTVNWFCEHFLALLEMSDKAKFLSYFLIELSLIEIEGFLDFSPSMISASAIVIARSILEVNDPWPSHMEQLSGYSLAELKPCVRYLFSQYTRKDEMPQKAVIEKYKEPKFARVSTIQPPLVLAVF